MTIITTDQAIQLIIQSYEWGGWFFGVVIDALGQNIIAFTAYIQTAWIERDWSSLGIGFFLLLTTIYLAYRLIHKNIIDALQYLSDRH